MFRKVVLAMAVVLFFSAQSFGESITVVTEEWPPYTYSENGRVVGVVSEIVRATLDRAGLDYNIETYPWARSYDEAMNNKNVLIYSIFRLPNRDNLFKWIKIEGLTVNMHLFRPKHRPEVKAPTLAAARKYKIGVTRETSTHHFLLSKGFKEGVNLFPVNSEEQNILKSNPSEQRIDLTTGDKLSMARWIKISGFIPDYWEEQVLLFTEDIYMAFGLQTQDVIVEKVRAAFNEIKAEGRIHSIKEKYSKMFQ